MNCPIKNCTSCSVSLCMCDTCFDNRKKKKGKMKNKTTLSSQENSARIQKSGKAGKRNKGEKWQGCLTGTGCLFDCACGKCCVVDCRCKECFSNLGVCKSMCSCGLHCSRLCRCGICCAIMCKCPECVGLIVCHLRCTCKLHCITDCQCGRCCVRKCTCALCLNDPPCRKACNCGDCDNIACFCQLCDLDISLIAKEGRWDVEKKSLLSSNLLAKRTQVNSCSKQYRKPKY